MQYSIALYLIASRRAIFKENRDAIKLMCVTEVSPRIAKAAFKDVQQ